MFSKLGALLCRAMLLLAIACCVYGTVVIGFKVPLIGWGMLALLSWRRYRNWQRRDGGYAHGTARVADAMDLFANGLLGQDGLIMGRTGYTAGPGLMAALRYLVTLPLSQSDVAVSLMLGAFGGKKWGRDSLIRIRNYVHLATFAATGAGKGVAALVPNLLSYLRSCVVVDPKCELFKLTGEHRRKLKHRIVRLDPFGLGGPGADSFNPLDLIKPDSPYLIDEARDLASMLVIRTGNEHEPHWNDMAELVLTTFIALVAATVTKPKLRNLQSVRELICNRESFTNTLEAIQHIDACGGMLRRLGAACGWLVDRELGSVLSSVQRHTSFLDSAAVAASTTTSSFDPRELHDKRMTVYLCLPADKLASHAPLQRMWVGSILRAVTRDGAGERSPVLFLLDEIGNIGHIQALEDAVTLLRSYGVRLWFFFQSIAQVKVCFGEKAATFLDNIGTQQFFGINSYESADEISKRMGDATIRNSSLQTGTSSSHSSGAKGEQTVQRSTSRTVSVSELGRRLLKPEEILCLPGDMMVIFHKNMPPIVGKLLRYFDAPEFRRGGTGRPRGRGVSALVRSLCFLGLSIVFAAFATGMPAPSAGGRRVHPYPLQQETYDPGPFYGGQPLPFAPPGQYLHPSYPANDPWTPPRR